MRNHVFVGGMLLTALFAVPRAAEAQVSLPVQLGLSGGAAFPMGELGRDEAVSTGWGFEVNAVMQVAPAVGVYAAYDRYTFEFDERGFLGIAQSRGDLQDQGFAGGVILAVPAVGLGLSPWIRGGAVYNSLEIDYDNRETDPESDASLGFEVGAGLEFPLGFVVSMSPSVRYRSYAADVPGAADFDMSYLVGELGLTFRF